MPYTQLAMDERDVIAISLAKEDSLTSIAKRLNRSVSTISREVHRNATDEGYRSLHAEQQARQRPCGRPSRKMNNAAIATVVKEKLRLNWSPEQIAGRLAHEMGARVIGRSTIYDWIGATRDAGQKWYRYLRRKGRPYRRRHEAQTQREQGRTPINERPATVKIRARFGDWEADSIEGCKGGVALVSCVERKSRYTIVVPVANRSARALREALDEKMSDHPWLPRHTLTVDNGREVGESDRLAAALGLDIYFTHPYHPWEKGAVENTNGLIRQYFPKGFINAAPAIVQRVEDLLNHRPRKCLGFKTPDEVLRSA